MMRSLYSAISGLKDHQVMMDTIGNNIANVNTPGFKSSRVTFATMLSQTLKGASAPATTPVAQGGSNAAQVGLGVKIGAIDQIMTQGSAQNTGKWSDMMIQGEGFFVLNNSGQTVYTRAGNFSTDSNGNLVDAATGAYVQGTNWGQLNGAESGTSGTWTGSGTDYIYTNPALKNTVANSTLTVTVTQNGTPLTSDSGSWSNTVGHYYYNTTNGTIDFYAMPTTTSPYNVTANLNVSTAATWSGSGPYSYTNSALIGASNLTVTQGGTTLKQASSLSTLAPGQYYFNSSTGAIYESAKPTSSMNVTYYPTAPTGNITITPNTYTNLNVDQNGNITGTNTSGTVNNLGQINMATFPNASGLTNLGNNYYSSSNNSGAAIIGVPGSGNSGTIVSNALEMSNVDLGQEMTNMIVAQRGFEANSRVITVGDTFLQTLVNLKQQ